MTFRNLLGASVAKFAMQLGSVADLQNMTLIRSTDCSSRTLKHQSSQAHKSAARAFQDKDDQQGELQIVGAPPAKEFERLLEELCQRKLPALGRKDRQTLFCLAEAIKAEDQQFLARACAVCLFRDERKGRLAIRFRAVTEELQVRSGSMGIEIDCGTGGRNLTQGTHRIMRRFCSRFAGCPSPSQKGREPKVKARVKTRLLQHLRRSVTCITVDAAADEILSSELMRASVWTESSKSSFCGARQAHASRRITSRPWSADDMLKDVLQHMCGRRYSIAKLVQFSEEVKRIFVEYAEATDALLRRAVRNFRAAAHRFESHSKPLGRTCLYIHACVRTAVKLTLTRTDASSQKAKHWLSWLSEERALLAAMLADATDSSIHLTRSMDNESLDAASISREVSLYLAGIKTLFVNGRCLTEFGYTSTMLTTLQRPVIFHLNGEAKSFGFACGVPEPMKRRCLARMQAWVKLAAAALEAEFPCFELAQAGQPHPVLHCAKMLQS